MLKHVAYFQIVLTLGYMHFAFANAERGDGDTFSRDADQQEVHQIKSAPDSEPASETSPENSSEPEDPTLCQKRSPRCSRETPNVTPDNSVQMISSQETPDSASDALN